MMRQITILTEFGNLHISFEIKDYLAKKNYPVVFVMPYPIYHENMSEIEFSTLAELFSIFMDRDS